jgi:DNA polymerase, archaea type
VSASTPEDLAAEIVLYGADPEERLLWIGQFDDQSMEIWHRKPDGTVCSRKEPLRAVAWVARGGPGAVALGGGLSLGFLATCHSWNEYQKLLKLIKSGKPRGFGWTDAAQQFLAVTGKTLFKGMEFEDLVRVQFDIETDTSDGFDFPHPERDRIAAIALSDSTGWEECLVVEHGSDASEKHVLEEAARLIAMRDPDVMEGHNIFKFDLPFLAARALGHGLKLLWGRGGSVLVSRPSRLQVAERTIDFTRFTARGRHFIDTWVLAQQYDVGTRELQSFGLKSVAAQLGVSEPGRVFIDGNQIAAAYRAGDPDFVTYALQDVRETRAVAAALSRSPFLQTRIFPFNYQDVVLRGNATKIDALFLREYLRQNHSIPEPPAPEPFAGGHTEIFETGILENVWHCDVTSLYPSLILAFGIGPRADALGLFAGLLGALRTFRLETKSTMKQADNPAERSRLDALQGAFKVLINSFYGYLGFAQGHLADYAAARDVAARGRQILGIMVDWLREAGARVIEIDTDGIYFQPPAGATPDALSRGMAEVLPEGIEVEFGKRFRSMFSYKAKNYALLDEAGEISIKGGALKSRGMEPYLREYLEEFIRLLLHGKTREAGALESQWLDRINARQIPITQLARTETLQDSPSTYQRKISASARNRSAAFEIALRDGRDYRAGDQVRYYITGDRKKVTAYEAAKPLGEYDPADPDENTAYYAAKLEDLAAKFRGFCPDAGDLFAATIPQ